MCTRQDIEQLVKDNQDDFEGCVVPVSSYERFLVKITAEIALECWTDEELVNKTVEEVMCETFYLGLKG